MTDVLHVTDVFHVQHMTDVLHVTDVLRLLVYTDRPACVHVACAPLWRTRDGRQARFDRRVARGVHVDHGREERTESLGHASERVGETPHRR